MDPQSGAGEAHSGGDAVVDVLEQAGVQVVFGIPSVHNLPIYDALARRKTIRPITVRHEQAAAGAADGYARVTGRVGVFLTSTGPGAANAMGGLLEAYVSGSPVLHLTGQIETQHLDNGRGFIHEVPDQPAMLDALSKRVLRAVSADDVACVVAEAIGTALEAPGGPVSVELPIDLQYDVAEEESKVRIEQLLLPERSRPPEPADVVRAADALAAARRPLVWAGGGAVASGAGPEVAELAEVLGAGVLTSPNGRGIVPEDDPSCIGNLSWDPGVRELCRDADLLVGVGTRFQGPNTENWTMELPAVVVQIDLDPSRPGRNYPASVAVTGDARAAVRSILDELAGRGVGGRQATEPSWSDRVASVAAAARTKLRSSLGTHEALLDATARCLLPGTVVVKDSTISAYTWANRLLPVSGPRTTIMPNGFAIGLGLPHAIGAAVGTGRPVVLVAGDGGFMLAIGELATIAAEHLPVVVLCFCDGGYGILRNVQDRQYGRRLGVELGRPDFVGVATALGVEAERVASAREYETVLRRALARGKPFLVEVDLDAIGPMARPYAGTSRPPVVAVSQPIRQPSDNKGKSPRAQGSTR
ncbi:MAG: thiamine pyrophosphate-binding protein [Acidimicrobiales bacterium]